MSKNHPGQSASYNQKLMIKAQQRGERELTRLTKEIIQGLKNKTLDHITEKTFRWIRTRSTHAEDYQRLNPNISISKDENW